MKQCIAIPVNDKIKQEVTAMEKLSYNRIIDNTPGRELLNVLKEQLKKSQEAKVAVGEVVPENCTRMKSKRRCKI